MDETPKLVSATFEFDQDGNCVDGGHEILTIKCVSSLGIDNDGDCFYVLETEQWAVDSIKDLEKLFDRVKKVVVNENKSK